MSNRKIWAVFFSFWIGFSFTSSSFSETSQETSFHNNSFLIYYSETNENYKKDDSELISRGWSLSEKEAQELESQVEKNPDDWSDRLVLISYYAENKNKKSESAKKAREKHILWIIENHPQYNEDSYGSYYLELSKNENGIAYDLAKELWLKQTEKYKSNVHVFFNAAEFFSWNDHELFEKFLKKCVELEPQNPKWHYELGNCYHSDPLKKLKEGKKTALKQSLDEFEKAKRVSKNEGTYLSLLCDTAEIAYEMGDLKKAKGYAGELLKKGENPQDKSPADYGNYIQAGYAVLGEISLASGNVKKADEYLITEGKTPRSASWEGQNPEMSLALDLLEKGEKDTVVQYLQDCSKYWKVKNERLKKWISLVKKGEKPNFYEIDSFSTSSERGLASESLKWKDIKESIHWASYSEAEQELKKGDKPILYDFSAEWCGPCKRLRKEVFGNNKTADWINRSFIPVMALDRQQEEGKNPPELEMLQKKYNVTGFPTLVLQFPNGKFKSTVGYGGADEIRKFLASLGEYHNNPLTDEGTGAYWKGDYSKALNCYQKSADQGDAPAQCYLGYMYERGLGIKQDYAKAVEWYQKSADQGFSLGQNNLGFAYEKGNAVKKDYVEALKWYRKSADQGNAFGQSSLGWMYESGHGVEKDYAKALKWFRKSVEQGNSSGQNNLGDMYEEGYGVKQDYSEALKLQKKSADQDDDSGQADLGEMYENGHGVTQDYAEALKWYRKSADQNNAIGQNHLGDMYENGHGVKQDYSEALKWRQKSANQEEETGQLSLGRMYENGHGVKQDYVEAYKWIFLGAENGFEKATKELPLLETHMTPEKILEAKKRAENWKPEGK